MRGLKLVVGVMVATVWLVCSAAPSQAATRARFRAETILNDPSVRIATGPLFSCQINEDGTVRCWGDNSVGELGNGTTSSQPATTPVLVTGINTAIALALGTKHACALLASGTVRCWGSDNAGQLGDGRSGDGIFSATSVPVNGISNAAAIGAGQDVTCAALAGGTLKCWGYNGYGEVGDGTQIDRPVPVTVLTNVISMSGGAAHACALLADGTVRCWGLNYRGALGDGTDTNHFAPQLVPNVGNAIAISTGTFHSCALIADGTAKCWGLNNFGQLGDGTTVSHVAIPVKNLSNAVAISAGDGYTCALLGNGTAKCWGWNNVGQLGDGTTQTRLLPATVGITGNAFVNAVAISANPGDCAFREDLNPGSVCNHAHSCSLIADGSAKCWGKNGFGELGNFNVQPGSLVPVAVAGGGGSITARDIAAGRSHTCAVRANGTVACWGNNDSGQIGDGTFGGTRLTPVAVPNLTNVVAIALGESHSCALKADGTARCWGLNSTGQLGSGTITDSAVPQLVSGLTNAVAIAAGGTLGSSHTCALLADGTARCWGANGSGQLGAGSGPGSSIPIPVPGLAKAVSIAVGETHSCAMVSIGATFCWGFNGSGQLGDGTTASKPQPTLVSLEATVAIAGGNSHTCAIRNDGTAWCWGGNLLGQLGINSTTSQSAPRLVVNLSNPVAIAGGFGHTCAVVADGTARCWGDNSLGQLGDNSTTQRLTPVVVTTSTVLKLQPAQLTTSAQLTSSQPTTQFTTSSQLSPNFGTISPTIGGSLTNVVQITTGRRHTCALFANGSVMCWGDNSAGQLGIGSLANQVIPASVPSFTLNIDPTVEARTNLRVATVTILGACEEGQQLHVEVTLTQGAVTGHGNGVGECTGGLTRYEVTVPAHGRDGWTEGSGTVSADAIILEQGLVVQSPTWTRVVQIVQEP
jgi:alpha-tubulin suppressor-like RCC1 family protein